MPVEEGTFSSADELFMRKLNCENLYVDFLI